MFTRNKGLDYRSIIAAALVIVIGAFFPVSSFADAASYQESLVRYYSLTTSENPDARAVIDVYGDTVSIEGYFAGDRLTDVHITDQTGAKLPGSITFGVNGAFSAEISGKPNTGTSALLYFYFKSGLFLYYRLEYDREWFIGDNALSDRLNDRINSATTASSETAIAYISASSDESEVRAALKKIEELSSSICADVESDYEKARLLSQWVSEHIYYDEEAKSTSVTLETIALYNVLETRKTTCSGFANLYSALLEAAGIESLNISGGVAAGGVTYETLPTETRPHEWVALRLPDTDRWIIADPCWDTANYYSDGEYTRNALAMKYFDITPIAFSFDHRADKAERRAYFSSVSYFSDEIDDKYTALENGDKISETSSEEKEESKDNLPLFIAIILFILGFSAMFVLTLVGISSKRKKE